MIHIIEKIRIIVTLIRNNLGDLSLKKVALITGITGQDGSYLSEFLLRKGYDVHGIIRRSSSFNTGRIDHLFNDPKIHDKDLFLYHGDLTDSSNLNRLLEKIKPDEIYNLAAQSHVKVSFDIPEYTAEVDAVGTLRFLDAIKETGIKTRFYQASTSELYGKVQQVPQTEKTPFYPRSPYGVANKKGSSVNCRPSCVICLNATTSRASRPRKLRSPVPACPCEPGYQSCRRTHLT